jgi:nucleoside-diphosphate-sugar epimerase
VVRAVVSGITGHVGQELARQLVAAGVEVHGISRARSAFRELEEMGVRNHQIDGRTETLIALFEDVQPDVVFHLAALARREHLSADVTPFINANILLGTQLLEASKLSGCGRFVTAGSYLQHGESGDYRPFNLYAATKQAFENVLAFYVDAFEFAAVVLTLCNIYSEHDPRRTLLTDIAAASTGKPLRLHAAEAWVDLVHVEDVAAAFMHVMTLLDDNVIHAGTLSKYSVSSGREITARELVALFERIDHRTIEIQTGERPYPARRVKPWSGTRVPGWEPRVSLEAGIQRLLEAQTGRGCTMEKA